MSLFNRNILVGASGAQGYKISRSVRLRSSASAYLNRTFGTATNQKIWTYSFWMKVSKLDTATVNNVLFAYGGNSDTQFLEIQFGAGGIAIGAYTNTILATSAVFRDPSAWYHVVIACDLTQATATNRFKVYVNGVQYSYTQGAVFPAQNGTIGVNSAVSHVISSRQPFSAGTNWNIDGYLTEINFIDGQALTPSSFGETNPVTGVWQPKKYAGTYGTNGFYLNFSDNSAATAAAIGKDYSGNGNNWTPNNISVTAGVTYDSMIDTPTPYADGGNGRGNYAVMNPIWKSSAASTSNANLTFSQGAALDVSQTTMGVSSGKWYWETTVSSVGATPTPMVGVVNGGALDSWTSANGYYYYGNNGQKYNNSTAAAYGATYSTNDVIGVALDLDAGTLTFYKNNVSQGTAYSSLSGTFFPAFSNGGGPTPSWSAAVNFGQRPFAYTPPTGFKALNTQNLPEPTIKKGNQYFDATLYTGNGSSQTISGLGFSPDLVWTKGRGSATYNNHLLYDQVRGVQKILQSNSTAAEGTVSNGLTAFNSNGFSIGSFEDGNTNNNAYVAWNWKANGAGATNTAGSITSTVSANTTSGFSVVTYTGTGANATVGHGLGVAPKMIFVKARNSAYEWKVWHTNLSSGYQLKLNNTDAQASDPTCFTTTLPTSTVFSVGTNVATNVNSQGLVAYCFAEVAGYSKFGSYTGNGSTDGPMVFTGFRPAYVLIKYSSGVENWFIADSSRDTYNVANADLVANSSVAEGTVSAPIDLLSNGFKIRTTATGANASGGTYIFAAFSEVAFKYALGR